MTGPHKSIKGRYRAMATHGRKPTPEDLLMMKFLEKYSGDYWSQVEVTDGVELGYIDIVLKGASCNYIVTEVKSDPKKVDEAIGQVLRYRLLFMKNYGLDEVNVQMGIVCSQFSPSHIEVFKQLKITPLSV